MRRDADRKADALRLRRTRVCSGLAKGRLVDAAAAYPDVDGNDFAGLFPPTALLAVHAVPERQRGPGVFSVTLSGRAGFFRAVRTISTTISEALLREETGRNS